MAEPYYSSEDEETTDTNEATIEAETEQEMITQATDIADDPVIEQDQPGTVMHCG